MESMYAPPRRPLVPVLTGCVFEVACAPGTAVRALRSKRMRPARMVISGTMRSVPETLPPARSA